MKRRDFLLTTGVAGVASLAGTATAGKGEKQQYLELRKINTLLGDKKKILNSFLRDVEIPALNRLGILSVGVFTVKFGANEPTLYMLLPHNSLESVATTNSRLLADSQFLQDGAEFLDTPISDPNYVRIETMLLKAFENMPKLKVPDVVKGKSSRIFEMRTYESHSRKAAKKKIEMFNKGGEIRIFREAGLHPVFFGEMLIGPRMPNLTYMLAFENMKERDKNWSAFSKHPDWQALKAKEEYKNTVSNITDIILRPASFSQI
ncbi:MAG: NIPSNAP family containing protein [Actinobacteria bacterium]|nr:NIPSNAP family containing protein [Actinomycetota bacterium]